jgi:hypothetical protein
MTLVSITPGEPCQVRVYVCARGSLLRNRLIDVKFNQTPSEGEIADMRKRPEGYLARLTEPEVA